MEWIRNPWLLAVVVLCVAGSFVADGDDARCQCQRSMGESNEALGEEFPEATTPFAISADTEALGEEFPE